MQRCVIFVNVSEYFLQLSKDVLYMFNYIKMCCCFS